MKLLILKENFQKCISIAEKFSGKNTTLPILENILLKTDKNILSCLCTDLETAIQVQTPAKIEKEGAVCVPVKLLAGLIQNIPDEKTFLEVKDNFLKIETPSTKTLFKIFSSEDFPIVPKIKKEITVKIPEEIFLKGLQSVVGVSSLLDLKPEITGVFVEINENKIKLAATDSFRLAEKTIAFSGENKEKHSFILPPKTASELNSVLSARTGIMNVYFEPAQIVFEEDEKTEGFPVFVLTSRLIDGEFPNYEQILPKKYKTKLVFKKDDLVNQIKTTSLFSGKINDINFSLNPSKREYKVFAKNADFGEQQAVLSGEGEGEDILAAFNWKFVLDGLQRIKSSEVTLELNGESGPGVLRPVGDNSFFYIMMPLKTA